MASLQKISHVTRGDSAFRPNDFVHEARLRLGLRFPVTTFHGSSFILRLVSCIMLRVWLRSCATFHISHLVRSLVAMPCITFATSLDLLHPYMSRGRPVWLCTYCLVCLLTTLAQCMVANEFPHYDILCNMDLPFCYERERAMFFCEVPQCGERVFLEAEQHVICARLLQLINCCAHDTHFIIMKHLWWEDIYD